jgi:hypothetical protein
MNTADACKAAANRCKDIAVKGKNAAVEIERAIQRRAVEWLHRDYPTKTAESLAAELNVSVRLAYYLLNGRVPMKLAHLVTLGMRRGAAFVNHVFHPISQAADEARLDARQHALEQQLAAEQADLAAEVAGLRPERSRRPGRVFAAIGRALIGRIRHKEAA